jgi:hypothetical protein
MKFASTSSGLAKVAACNLLLLGQILPVLGSATVGEDSLWIGAHSDTPSLYQYDENSEEGCGTGALDVPPCGPSNWKDIPGANNQCGGTSQSPINIEPTKAVVDENLMLPKLTVVNGGCSDWTQFSNDHAFEVAFAHGDEVCENLSAEWKGTKFHLKQLHYHTLSEHTIEGLGHPDAEVGDTLFHLMLSSLIRLRPPPLPVAVDLVICLLVSPDYRIPNHLM